jgi:hypothetical protein
VTTKREFDRRSVVGDNIEGDHSPSAAALIAAKERELGFPLSAAEKRAIEQDGIVVAVPKDVHAESRTFKGRNTSQQIDDDSLDFIVAACKDAACRADSMRKRGVSEAEIKRINDALIAEAAKLKPKAPPKPPTLPKPPVPPKPKKPKGK